MRPIFAAEPIRRYFLWAGATPDEALDFAISPYPETADWMPTNKATGKPYTNIEFITDMGKFAEMLPNNGYDFHWQSRGTDPYLTTDVNTDAVTLGGDSTSVDPVFIGLTGERGVGKSFLTTELEKIGFMRVHPFNPGKALLRGYYVTRGATEDEALAMTDGVLKDVPAPRDVLPVNPETGENYTSRFVMEKLGWFMANVIGLSSTIGTEMRHWAAAGKEKILIDSVVYETDEIREMPNSAILGIKVPAEKRKNTGIIAETTDAAVAKIVPNGWVVNDMNGAGPLMDNFYATCTSCGITIPQDDPDTPRP